MSISEKLRQFLIRHKIYYQVAVHPQAFTSPQTAEAEHISGKQVAKVVMAKVNGRDVMLILPSNRTVDLFKLSKALRAKDVRIEQEKEFKDLFPECEVGAMPPFGAPYHLHCYVDKSIEENPQVYFNAGTHTQSIWISTADLIRAVKGRVYDFSVVGKKLANQRQEMAS